MCSIIKCVDFRYKSSDNQFAIPYALQMTRSQKTMSCSKYLEAFCFLSQGLHPSTSIGCGSSGSGSAIGGPVSSRPGSASIYIPVNALQNLRASMPALATSASVTSLPSVSRSTASLSIAAGKSPGQSFLSSVISSKPFAGLTSGLAPPSSFPGLANSILSTFQDQCKKYVFNQCTIKDCCINCS